MAAAGFRFPVLVHETLGTAVKGVRPVVYGKLILRSVDGELTLGDTVGISSGGLFRTRAVAYVVGGLAYPRATSAMLPSLSGTTTLTIPAPRLDTVTDAPEAFVKV